MAKLVPQKIEFADTAPVRAEGTALVDGAPAEVWAVLLDYESWPTWFAGVKRCRATSDPVTGVGSTREVVLVGGSRIQERFVAWEEDVLWSFTATEMTPAPFRSLVERVTIAGAGPGRTRVTYRMAFEPKAALRPVAPLLAKAQGRNLTKAMERLAAEVVERR